MFSAFTKYFIALALICLSVALASPDAVAAEKSAFLESGSVTLTPMGWADFCSRYRGDCKKPDTFVGEIAATAANIELIRRVNRQVNANVKPVSDMDHWHQVDRWDYAEDGSGDCEDYVLLKRKILMAAGLPQGALLVTVVRDEMLDGHAVLTVRTDRGDLILDNMNDELRLWSRVPYRFVKMQSSENPNVWVSVGPAAARPQIVSR